MAGQHVAPSTPAQFLAELRRPCRHRITLLHCTMTTLLHCALVLLVNSTMQERAARTCHAAASRSAPGSGALVRTSTLPGRRPRAPPAAHHLHRTPLVPGHQPQPYLRRRPVRVVTTADERQYIAPVALSQSRRLQPCSAPKEHFNYSDAGARTKICRTRVRHAYSCTLVYGLAYNGGRSLGKVHN